MKQGPRKGEKMKSLILCVLLMSGAIFLPGQAGAEDPVDLAALQEAGLSPETIGRYLAQNLDGTRLAPPIRADLLSRLGEYGGDELAAAYLKLDKETAYQTRRDFSPEVVEGLLAGDVGADKLKNVLEAETAKAIKNAGAAPPLAPPAPSSTPRPNAAPPRAEILESDLPAPPQPREAPTVPPRPPALPAAAPPQAAAAPQAPAPQVSAPAPPAAPQARFQRLRPGEAADPGSPLRPPLDTYELRAPAAEGPRLGVTERELADGHRVEVNTMGDPNLVGQEVIERPSGRKVYRYHSGNTGKAAPMTDPEQERRNREDLMIIHNK